MNIVLVGMPGSGKTSVSKVFSSRGKTVCDTDELIVKEHGAIKEIFARYGEKYFRDLETQTVKKLSDCSDAVIATGGGCVTRPENVNLLKTGGKIFYLKTSVEVLLKRVEGNFERPLLLGDSQKRLEKLLKERATAYENSADFIISTDELSPEEIADKITELMK